jgi:hypothetical protein
MNTFKVGTVIVYHKKLDKYLKAVKKCFEHWGKVVTVEADFKQTEEADARNQGIEQLSDHNFIWTVDADEFILKADQERILDNALKCDRDFTLINVIDYTTFKTVMFPPRDGTPIVLLKSRNIHGQESGMRFSEGRCANGNMARLPASLHHFGLCFPQEIQRWKADNYWNKANAGEYAKLLQSETKPAEIPSEIRDLFAEFGIKEVENENSGAVDHVSVKEKKRAVK